LRMMATLRRIAVLLLALLTLAGCSALGDDSSSSNNQASGGSSGAPEKSKVKVAVLPTMDTVPLHLAIESGAFKEAGLEVTPVTAASGADCVAKLVSGEVDFAFSSWTPLFIAKSKGAADIKLVADATSSRSGYAVVSTLPNSPIQSVKDLAGKRVAITARFTISHLLVQAHLKANGIDPDNGVQWVEMAFPQMTPALQGGQVDAVFLVEPFIQAAVKQANVRQVFDTSTNPTADLPLTGYGATANFVNGNKRTVEAFQRAMKKATDQAHGDRTKVEPLLEKIAKVDAETSKKTVLADFVSSLDPARIQRVVDLMVEFKALDKRIDVNDMIVRPPAA
jgi:NitT/TauT family transport system substrate-binding protein